MILSGPKVVQNENVRPFDCDGCLIVRHTESDLKADIRDPVTGGTIRVGVNRAMVRLLQEERQRGSFVVVWSRSGWEWARNIVNALGLQADVDLVMSKPIAYFDDTPVEEWMKDRVFIGPDVEYKR